MTTATKNGKKQPSMKERAKSRRLLDRAAKKTGELTAAERRALLAQIHRDLDEASPGLDVAESDLFQALLVLGAESVARYFPDASSATFHVTKYAPHNNGPVYSLMLPMAVPNPSGAYAHLKAEPTSAGPKGGA